GGRSAREPSRRGDVPRQDRREGLLRTALQRAAPSLHPRAPRGRAPPGPRPQTRPPRARGRRAVAHRSARGVRFPPALSEGPSRKVRSPRASARRDDRGERTPGGLLESTYGMTDERVRIGRYEVEVPLGEGPVGRVFIARDPVLGRRVALKVLRRDLPLSDELRGQLADRVRQEARSAAMLSHPGLATVHDMGDEPTDATPYLVFEFLKGPTLRRRLASAP